MIISKLLHLRLKNKLKNILIIYNIKKMKMIMIIIYLLLEMHMNAIKLNRILFSNKKWTKQ